MAVGASGFPLPTLAAGAHRVAHHDGDGHAIVLARSLLTADLARPQLWAEVGRDPPAFLEAAFQEWIDRHAPAADVAPLDLAAELSTGDTQWSHGQVWMEPSGYYEGAVLVTLRPALDLLAREGEVWASTLYARFGEWTGRWLKTFGIEDARNWRRDLIQYHTLNGDDLSAEALGEVEIPAILHAPPLDADQIRGWMGTLRQPRARALMRALLEIHDRSMEQEPIDVWSYLQPPVGDAVPGIVAAIDRFDVVHSVFDEVKEFQAEGQDETPLPNLFVPFDCHEPEYVHATFQLLATACRTVAAAGRLLQMIQSLPHHA